MPRPVTERVSPSAFRVASTLVAVARATPHSRVIPRADGTGVYDTPLAQALADAGFRPTPRGLRLRS